MPIFAGNGFFPDWVAVCVSHPHITELVDRDVWAAGEFGDFGDSVFACLGLDSCAVEVFNFDVHGRGVFGVVVAGWPPCCAPGSDAQGGRSGVAGGDGGDGFRGSPFGVVVTWESMGGGVAQAVDERFGFAGFPAWMLAGLVGVAVAGFDHLHGIHGAERGAGDVAAGDDVDAGWAGQTCAGALFVAVADAFDVFHEEHGGGFGLGFVVAGVDVVPFFVVVIREGAMMLAAAAAVGGFGEVDEVVFVADVGAHDVLFGVCRFCLDPVKRVPPGVATG